MNWDDLRIFLAIARSGTLGSAAKLTGQTQPTMGRRLRSLESSVGRTLFQRTADGFVLTEDGIAIFALAERIEADAQAIERKLAGQEQQLSGTLRVSSSDWFGEHVLTPVFAEFLQRHPRVSLELVTESRQLNLARREADLLFRNFAFEEVDVVQRKFLHLEYALYGPESHEIPLAGDGAGCALLTMNSDFGTLPDVAWLKGKLPRAHVAFGSNSRGAQARMCATGAGLAVLPCLLGDHTAGIRRIDLGEAPPGRDVWLGYHRDLRRQGRLRALVDFVIERLAGDPPAHAH